MAARVIPDLLLPAMMLPLLCCSTPRFLRRSTTSSKQQRQQHQQQQQQQQQTSKSSQQTTNFESQSEEGLVLADRRPRPAVNTSAPASSAAAASTVTTPSSPELSPDRRRGRAVERPGLTPTVTRQSSILWTKPLPQLPPAHMALSGKIALVTGGARGIGAAIALKLAQDGARVRPISF